MVGAAAHRMNRENAKSGPRHCRRGWGATVFTGIGRGNRIPAFVTVIRVCKGAW